MSNLTKLNLKIEKTPIDVCPLCGEQIGYEDDGFVGVRRGRKLFFYAHKRCVKILDTFILKVQELI